MAEADVKTVVREKYGQAALQVGKGGCCGASSALDGCDPITSNPHSSPHFLKQKNRRRAEFV